MATKKAKFTTAALLTAAAAALAGGAAAGASGSSSTGERITMSFLTIRGKDKPVHVVATGPIHGIGSETQNEKETRQGEIIQATLHFDEGTVQFVAREPRFGFSPDRRTCTARAFGGGTFRIAGGTGAYQGATGNGTFKDGGIAIAQRAKTGKCLGERTPPANVVFYITIKMTGNASVPSP